MGRTIDAKVDGTPLSREERKEINQLLGELYSPTTVNRATGGKTRRIMEIRGVVSPRVTDRIKISSNPLTWVVPKQPLDTQEDIDLFIKQMKKKYKLK